MLHVLHDWSTCLAPIDQHLNEKRMSNWELKSRNDLEKGQYFRHVGHEHTEFVVKESAYPVHPATGHARLLTVYCPNGAWAAWMDLDTGVLYRDSKCEKECSMPFAEIVEVKIGELCSYV
jgi:hypothetical protein